MELDELGMRTGVKGGARGEDEWNWGDEGERHFRKLEKKRIGGWRGKEREGTREARNA